MTESSRLAAHITGKTGASNAETGLAMALARNASGANIPITADMVMSGIDGKVRAELSAKLAPKVDLYAERSTGRRHEQQRWAKVFGGEASNGRERQAAALLAHADNFPPENILAALAKGPTDAERDRAQASKASGDVWGKVIAGMSARNGL